MADEYNDTVDPFTPLDTTFEKRLINFETGKHTLQDGHKKWLDFVLGRTPATREFFCDIYGYASKLGKTAGNTTLSYDRANEVAKYLEQHDAEYTTRIRAFEAVGDHDPRYKADLGDNDGRWRAVEVHVNFDRPPPPKPHIRPIPRPETHMKWSVCGYFSLNITVEVAGQVGSSL